MADAIVSSVVEQLIAIIKEQIQSEIQLVRGVDKEVLNLSDELKRIRNVLNNAENRRFKDKEVNRWLVRLERASYAMEDILDEWNYAILKLKMEGDQSNDAVVAPLKQKVRSFIRSSCFCFKETVVRHDIAKKIQNVKEQLDQIVNEEKRYNFVISPTNDPSLESWRDPSTSFIEIKEVCGRDEDRGILVSKVIANGGSQEKSGIHILSIVGVGGLGKTTLAQLVYNDSEVKNSFNIRIWVCVSKPFDVAAIAKGIIETVKCGNSPSTNNLQTLLQCVKDSISGKKFFLVLDDVWTEFSENWKSLKACLEGCGASGSKILVTTRNQKVAEIMSTTANDIHRPKQLTKKDSWLLLSNAAQLSQRNKEESFEEIGKKIADKCDGLPLAARTLGSLLLFKDTLDEWEAVLNSELWELEEEGLDLFPHLLLSYNELSPTLRCCFSYCAIFPKDYVIVVEDLLRYWMALGYLGSKIESDMELEGRKCFNTLANRSLFQDFKKNDLDGPIVECKMHDIVHDFAQYLRKTGKVEGVGMNTTTCQVCQPLLISTVNEFCSLFEAPPNLCDCLTRLRVLNLGHRLQSFPQKMEKLIHLRWLNLVNYTLSQEDFKIIFQLYNLQTLCLISAIREELPREIGNLIHLRHLDMSRNLALKELPREIGNLTHLRHLNMTSCDSLKELPKEIGNLIQLRHLHMSRCVSLKELPSEIGNLEQLRHLDLSMNRSLKELPREIGNLDQLRHLDLSMIMSLKELPREIGNLTHLRHLNMTRCMFLEELPKEIGNLIQLRHLHMSMCVSLKELPREIGNLTQLGSLDLSQNWSLMELPKEIGNLTQLGSLDLSQNWSLMELPKEIGNLIQLRRLDLSGNESLKELPREIGNLIQLRRQVRL